MSFGIKCPACRLPYTEVFNDGHDHKGTRRRLRKCLECNAQWSTDEVATSVLATLVNKNTLPTKLDTDVIGLASLAAELMVERDEARRLAESWRDNISQELLPWEKALEGK